MDPVITAGISISMSLLFAVAAAHKLRAPAVFRSAVQEYRLLPKSLSGITSILLIMSEMLAAVLVLIPPLRDVGFAAMAGLLLVYTAGIGINLLRGRRDMDCGCGGPASKHSISGWLVLRNALLFGLVLLGWQPTSGRPMNWLDLLVIGFAVLIASGLYLGMNQLLEQATRMARLQSNR